MYIYITLHYIALHCIALHYITLRYITYIDMTWHDMTWHDMTWHDIYNAITCVVSSLRTRSRFKNCWFNCRVVNPKVNQTFVDGFWPRISGKIGDGLWFAPFPNYWERQFVSWQHLQFIFPDDSFASLGFSESKWLKIIFHLSSMFPALSPHTW